MSIWTAGFVAEGELLPVIETFDHDNWLHCRIFLEMQLHKEMMKVCDRFLGGTSNAKHSMEYRAVETVLHSVLNRPREESFYLNPPTPNIKVYIQKT